MTNRYINLMRKQNIKREQKIMIDKITLGKRIKTLREKAGLSQTQLAHCLDVDQSLISKFESGERTLSILQIENIASILCYPVKALTSEIEDFSVLPSISFRADRFTDEDILALSKVNKIFLNQIKINSYRKNK